MNKVFYGLWISRDTNPNDIIETGIWENKFSNKERIPTQMAKFKVGDEVFLYQGTGDVKVKNTPFDQFVSSDYQYKDNTLTKVKCWAIGKVKKVHKNSLEIDWDKNYTPNEWYSYFRQDGAWEIEIDETDNKRQKKYQELYKMAFEGKEQDYEWWFKNGILKRKNNIQGNENMKLKTNQNKIKNIILYGAPGVGKTHNINRLISLIEEDKSDEEIFESLKKNEFADIIDIEEIKNRIKFVTFHQSFGYEDFIEGFRPNQEGKIELVDGIFKNICLEAQKNLDNSLKDNSLDVDSLLNDFANFVQEQGGVEIDSDLKIDVVKNSDGEFKSFVTKGRVDSQSLTKSIISRDIEDFLEGKIYSYKDIKPTYESKSPFHGNALYYYKLYQKIKDFINENGAKTKLLPHNRRNKQRKYI